MREVLGASVLLHEKDRHEVNRRVTRLLFTGSGRCGTKWIAAAMCGAGVECGHELAFDHEHHGDRPWVAESSWCAVPYLSTIGPETYLVHLVRDPLLCIGSRAAWGTFWSEPVGVHRLRKAFALEHCPEVALGRNPIERSAIHWVAWNKRIANADELVRIEDVSIPDIGRWCSVLGVSGMLRPLPPRTMNTAGWSGREAVSYSQIEHVPGLLSLAKRYGYLGDT